MSGTRIAHTYLRMMVGSCVALVGLAVAAPAAWADPCPPLDLGCAVETTGSTAGGVVDQTTATVGGVVEDATTIVGGVVEDATTTVGGVVEDATTIVEGVVEGVGPGDVGPIVEQVVPAGGAPAPTAEEATLPGDATPPGGGVSSPGGGTHVGRPPAPVEPTRPIIVSRPPADVATSGTEVRRDPGLLEDGQDASLFGSRLVPVLAFPLALVLLVIGFIVVQNRIDRKDPKLALAPVETDYLTFS